MLSETLWRIERDNDPEPIALRIGVRPLVIELRRVSSLPIYSDLEYRNASILPPFFSFSLDIEYFIKNMIIVEQNETAPGAPCFARFH